MRDKLAVDTNILFYAIDRESDKHEKALEFMNKAGERDTAITLRSLSECYNLALNRNKAEAEKAAEFVHSLKHDPVFKIIIADRSTLDESLDVSKDFWDRLIEATALENGYEVIYTENTSDFQEIDAINPLQ